MMKKVIIHAGPGKTGTSAVQHWLNNNSVILEKNGFWYPEHTTDSNNVSSGNLNWILDKSENNQWNVSQKKIDKIKEELEKSQFHTLILSSEFFFHKISDLYKHFNNANFIVYLRNPLELAESGYNQSVKRHGTTTPLNLPKNLDSSVLNFLSRIISKHKTIKLDIRPYDKELFVNRSLVSDFLSAISIEQEIINNEVINPSYTLQALEFKRYINHFQIGHIEHEIDRILQVCEIGEREYSFINDSQHDSIKSAFIAQLSSFIDKHHYQQLIPYQEALVIAKQKPYFKQYINDKDLKDLVTYVNLKNPEIFTEIAKKIESGKNQIIPNKHFYKYFNVEHKVSDVLVDINNLKNFTHEIKNLNNPEDADICRTIALYFEKENNLDMARYFMEAAHIFRPSGPFILHKVNQYRKNESPTPTQATKKNSFIFKYLIPDFLQK